MSYQQLFLWSKKIHRLAMWVVMLLSIAMGGSGMVMHRELEGEWLPELIDTLVLREWHNRLSTPFAIFLGIMLITGLIMWGVPKILSKRNKQS